MTSPLLGTWTLVRWYNEASDGSTTEPFGQDARGTINYSADGHMFAHLAKANRPGFASADMADGTPGEESAAMKSHVSYTGTYDFHGDHVVHLVEIASFPNWAGTDQRRQIQYEDGLLRLSSQPFSYRGKTIVAHAVWRRSGI